MSFFFGGGGGVKQLTETVLWELFSQAGFYAGLRSPGAALLTGCNIRKGSQRGTVSHSSTLSHSVLLSLRHSAYSINAPVFCHLPV